MNLPEDRYPFTKGEVRQLVHFHRKMREIGATEPLTCRYCKRRPAVYYTDQGNGYCDLHQHNAWSNGESTWMIPRDQGDPQS